MTDTVVVLNTLFMAYSMYVIAILSLYAWLAYGLTHGETKRPVSKTFFWSYVGFLVVTGVSLHILTYNKIPWVAMDLKRADLVADQTFHIVAKDHKFILPEEKMVIQCGELVKFVADSEDLTYGFGLFRADASLEFQMQIVPGSENMMPWRFHRNAVYDIRSTEYSGPAGAEMGVKNAVEVVGCDISHDVASRGGER